MINFFGFRDKLAYYRPQTSTRFIVCFSNSTINVGSFGALAEELDNVDRQIVEADIITNQIDRKKTIKFRPVTVRALANQASINRILVIDAGDELDVFTPESHRVITGSMSGNVFNFTDSSIATRRLTRFYLPNQSSNAFFASVSDNVGQAIFSAGFAPPAGTTTLLNGGRYTLLDCVTDAVTVTTTKSAVIQLPNYNLTYNL